MRAEELIGKVLHDTHRIVGKIGEGATGAVYEARHVRLSDELRFAVKVLHEQRGSDPEYYARFRREAETVSRIHHPNIVEIKDFYRTESGRPCIVMEHLDGRDLAEVLRHGPLPPEALVEVVRQVAEALQAVHDRGIVHRDIKPGNIFLVASPGEGVRVKVLDFGISKVKGAASVLTMPKVVLGTPGYMAPEQVNGQSEAVGRRTDIFALGVICHEALTGQRPFRGLDYKAVFFQICEREPPPVSLIHPDLPPALDAVVTRAMAKDPAHRYADARDLARDLLRATGIENDAGQNVLYDYFQGIRLDSSHTAGGDSGAKAGEATEDYLPGVPHAADEDRLGHAPTLDARGVTAEAFNDHDPRVNGVVRSVPRPKATEQLSACWPGDATANNATVAAVSTLAPTPTPFPHHPPPGNETPFGHGFWLALGLVSLLLLGGLLLATSRRVPVDNTVPTTAGMVVSATAPSPAAATNTPHRPPDHGLPKSGSTAEGGPGATVHGGAAPAARRAPHPAKQRPTGARPVPLPTSPDPRPSVSDDDLE